MSFIKNCSFWYVATPIITVVLDQITKSIAQKNLMMKGRINYLDGFFRLEYAENPGAFLSFGANLSPSVRFWIFSVLVGGFLIYATFELYKQRANLVNAMGLSLVIGGGIGNLIDRILNGRVIDFMNMGIGGLRTGIFNVADVAIMAGFVLLIWPQKKAQKEPSTNPS